MRLDVKKLGAWGGALVVVVLAWFGATHLFARKADAKTPPPLATVQKAPLAVTVEATGTAQPVLVVEVKSRASGQLLALNAETGQTVPRGFLLAQVDPRDARNAVDQARAQLVAARAKLENSSAALRRAELMLKDQVITQQEYDADRAQAIADQSAASIAQTNYDLAAQKLGDPTIEAPIAGTIIEKDVEAGQIIASASQTVSGGTTLFKMADLSTMQIKAEVDETDIGRVQPGQRALVSIDAYPGRTFVGTVQKVEPQAIVDQNVTMFDVLVDLDNRQGLIKPGMNADVQIQVERLDEAVVVPNDAVVSPKDAATVAQALGMDPATVQAQMAAARAARGQRQGQRQGQTGGRGFAGVAGDVGAAGSPGGSGSAAAAGASWGGRGGNGGSGSWGGRGGAGSGSGMGGLAAGAHPGVVFVETATGPQARFVLLGMNDLDNSQVLRGLQPGEKVVLASVARLEQQQQNQQNQLKQRAGSMLGGGSGGSGGGRGGARG